MLPKFTSLVSSLKAFAVPLLAATALLTFSQHGNLFRFAVTPSGPKAKHQIIVDDSATLHAPVYRETFRAHSLEIRSTEQGLIPGLRYYTQLDGGAVQAMNTRGPVTMPNAITCKLLRDTWEQSGRLIGRANSGLEWRNDHWEIKPHAYLLGPYIYNAEMRARPAIAAARACHDLATLDELAQYYTVMLTQTEAIEHLLARGNTTAETRARMTTVAPQARTFAASFGGDTGEGELYNTQWLHPGALLLRIVTELPAAERTQAMRDFAAQFAPFLVRDQLLRYLFQQSMPPLDGVSPRGRVAQWQQILAGARGAEPWARAMSDIDLWLLASTAEVLGANANSPELVPLTAQERTQLRGAIAEGVALLQSKRRHLPETRDFSGKQVGSDIYFEGDYAAHEDMAYSAVEHEAFPLPAERKAVTGLSWDASHIYRLPILLRALFENRKATGQTFPTLEDLRQVTNQYVFREFNGRFDRPLFRNYFDGHDGWQRVGFAGPGSGNPPSLFCNMKDPRRLCLTPGAIQGWGELAFVNDELARLEQNLVEIAFRNESGTNSFLDRYYSGDESYGLSRTNGVTILGVTLYAVVAENASASLAGCSQENCVLLTDK